MKKMILLFTMVCAVGLNGMENPKQGRYADIEGLPPEVKVMLISYLHTYDNLDDIIEAIKAVSQTNTDFNAIVNDMYGNQRGFTTLVHMLTKIPTVNTEDGTRYTIGTEGVAYRFGTPAAKLYLDLCGKLSDLLESPDASQDTLDSIKKLINEGKVDINCTTAEGGLTVLHIIAKKFKKEFKESGAKSLHTDQVIKIIKVLLEHGANPAAKDLGLEQTPLEWIIETMENNNYGENNIQKVKQVFKEATKK